MNTRQALKRSVKQGFRLLALPLYLTYRLAALAGNPDSAFQGTSQALSLIPGKIGIYLRAAFYHLACPGTSDEIVVGFLTIFSQRNTTIRRGVYIGPQCNIGMCDIGEGCLIGSGVHILSGNKQHNSSDIEVPIQQQGGSYRKIIIEKDCWIGNKSVVMENLSQKSIVAAGSVVTKHVVEGSIIAGNPARLIKKRGCTNNA